MLFILCWSNNLIQNIFIQNIIKNENNLISQNKNKSCKHEN